jgi:endoglucanase
MMTDILPFLKQLISAPGLSGYEAPVRNIVVEAWQPLTDELHISRLGLHIAAGNAPCHGPAPIMSHGCHWFDGHRPVDGFCA